jgi:chromosome segregation ATPase
MDNGRQEREDAMSDIERLIAERDAAQAEVERLTAERDEARAEVERLIAERDEAQSESVRLKTERDEQKRQNYQVVYGCDALVDSARRRAEKATAERDEARAEVERLRANGQGMFDSSRPSDEDIWREAFMNLLIKMNDDLARLEADRALTTYRKRWPR